MLATRVHSLFNHMRLRVGCTLTGGGDFEYWGCLSNLRNQKVIGDKWLSRGAAQFAFLRSIGLSQSHRFLDYGCAVLATAAHVIPFLQPGNYVGIDVASASVNAGARRLTELGIDRRRYHLLQASEPMLPELDGFEFDFVFAASVFQYLRPSHFEIVLKRLLQLLTPSGRFVTTYSTPNQRTELKKKRMHFYGVDEFSKILGKPELYHPREWGSLVAVYSGRHAEKARSRQMSSAGA